MMQDRPDLIQSELAGLAFDSLQQVFRKADVVIAMSLSPLICTENPTVFVVIDPAAGGPQSDYAIVSIIRHRGSITVSKSFASFASFLRNRPRVRAPRDESRRVTLICWFPRLHIRVTEPLSCVFCIREDVVFITAGPIIGGCGHSG